MIDVVEVVHELTDEDVGDDAEQDEDDEQSAEDALKLLIEGLVSLLNYSSSCWVYPLVI